MKEFNPYDLTDEFEAQYKKLADAEAQLSEVEMLKPIIKANEMLKSQASSAQVGLWMNLK